MLKKIDKYLLLNLPKVWKSRIHWNLIISFILCILFYIFGDRFDSEITEDNSDREDINFIIYLMIFWSSYLLFWLYLQYQNKSPLINDKLVNIISYCMLNILSLSITILPMFILTIQTLDDEYVLADGLLVLNYIIIGGLIPIAFLSLIIRFYSLMEITLTIIISFFYVFIGSFLIAEGLKDFLLSEKRNVFIMFSIINYIFLLFYIVFKVQAYNLYNRVFALTLILYTPWAMLLIIFLFVSLPFKGFFDIAIPNSAAMIQQIFSACFLLANILLTFILWKISINIKNPLRVL